MTSTQQMPSTTMAAVAMRPTTTSVLPEALGYHSRKKSIVKSVAEALNLEASEAISATIMPQATMPRRPCGRICATSEV